MNDLRAASEQDAIAASERQAAMKALLANETEVRSCSSAHFEGHTVHAFLFYVLKKKLNTHLPIEQLTRHQTEAIDSKSRVGPTYEYLGRAKRN